MKKLIVILALMTPFMAMAQTENTQTGSEIESVSVKNKEITVRAKGLDVRSVLYDLFEQTGHNFIIDDGVRHVLYLNLAEVDFSEALHVILKHADLGYEVKDEIYYIGKGRSKAFKTVEAKTTPKPVETGHGTTPPKPLPQNPPAQGKLDPSNLQKRLTTRMAMADIREVFKEFAKQAGVTIEVDPAVPYYKIDAFLLDTSLKYALDVVTEATKLEYTLTDKKTILISVKK